MARLFLRLKWTLIVNGVRRHPWGAFNAAGMLVFLVAIGGVAGLGVALLGRADLDAWLPAIFALLFVLWLVLPVAAYGVDETLDPTRLAPIPLAPIPLMTGLLSASVLSAGGGATILVLLGVLVGFGGGPATVVVVVAAAAELVLCLAAGRAITTLASGMLGSRRGRDLVTTLVFLLTFALVGLFQLPQLLLPRMRGSQLTGFVLDPADTLPLLRFTPPGQAGLAIVHARAGAYGQALLALLLVGVWVVLLVAVWWWGLQNLSHRSGDAKESDRVRSRLVPGALRPLLPAGRIAAVTARELRYLVRQPARRIRLVQNVVAFVPLAMLPIIMGAGTFDDPRLVLLAAAPPLLLLNETGMQFGSDGGALWAHVATPGSWRDDILGRNLANLIVALPLFLVAAVVLGVLTGGWRYVVFALPLAVMTWGIGAGLGNVLAVRLPIPVPEPEQGNLFGTNAMSSEGCLFGIAGMAALAASAALAAPVAWAAWRLHDRPATLALTSVVGAVYGLVVWQVGARGAARYADRRQDEILAIVTVSA